MVKYRLPLPLQALQIRLLHSLVYHHQHHNLWSLVPVHPQHQLEHVDPLAPSLQHINLIIPKILNKGVNIFLIPSSVEELVLPHQIASLILGGAKAGPWRKEELWPSGTPRSDVEALAPPKRRTNSPYTNNWFDYIFVLLTNKTKWKIVCMHTLSFALSRMRVNEASMTRFCPFSIEEAETVVNDDELSRCK